MGNPVCILMAYIYFAGFVSLDVSESQQFFYLTTKVYYLQSSDNQKKKKTYIVMWNVYWVYSLDQG
jgi:hypothetical protein